MLKHNRIIVDFMYYIPSNKIYNKIISVFILLRLELSIITMIDLIWAIKVVKIYDRS